MALDLCRYLEQYQNSGDDGDDGEVTDHIWNMNMNCTYYDIDDIHKVGNNNHGYKYTTIHLNIHSLPSKYDQIRNMLSELKDKNIAITFIMLCETFLTVVNCDMFPIPGYQFVCNNRQRGREVELHCILVMMCSIVCETP